MVGMSDPQRSRLLWPGIALFLILPGLLYGGLEWYERRKYDRLKEELDRVLYPVEDTRVALEPDGALRIYKGGGLGGPFRIGLAVDQEANPRWQWWSVQAVPNPPGTDKIGFLVQLSQERRLLLLSPRITVASIGSPHPALIAYVDDLFTSRGIPYEQTSYEAVMSK